MLLNSNNSSLLDKVIYRINASPEKKITFAEYMDMCLYDEQYGYYTSKSIAIGPEGDFFTSSSISSDFGELLAIQMEEFWQVLGQPKSFRIVEMGAGEGILAKIILDYLQSKFPSFYECIQYLIIEKSTALKIKQKETVNPTKYPIIWQDWQEIDSESIIGCFISNELMDALPVHRIIKDEGELKEIYVTVEDGNLREIYNNFSTDKIEEYLMINHVNLREDSYPHNYQTEVNLFSLEILAKIAQKLKRGYVLTVDYGYDAQKFYHPQRYEGTLKCYYQHRHHHNPYVNLGIQDITSHVNFTALVESGLNFGLDNLGLTQQALFLMELGLGDRLNDLSSGKILLSELWQRRNQLHELINPQGLGGFYVLLQGKNLRETERKQTLKGFTNF
ncbi:class I SAM-dependent methyltransferase [Cyanobacterium stanieri LEGE 03274]|uniref:Class I SAM-dependent methyltransferase n=1 Tax=Cyanobacterium stanieri LEGE 03274 TaxID=1828756 RepID=A0ABR9V195_9CHRO|nr:class I SAM-dependent methyltransferase [Cyanobacterium stanieri]MBE9221663.1 class I SAM-dependent methyltransferase [Cyanobacterium stanieri LEGE 03274]